MKKKFKRIMFLNLLIILSSIINIYFINNLTVENIRSYTISFAKKITKYLINSVYIDGNLQNNDSLYEIVKGKDGEIKTIDYSAKNVNKILEGITNRIYDQFYSIETGNIKGMNINENIITNTKSENKNGIILEVPSFIMTGNYLLNNLGPKIPVKLSLTGGFDSFVSTEVKEYGLNNAVVVVYLNIKVTEQITMPFFEDEIFVENQIPVAINLINGKIPEYYLGGFTTNSNMYKSN